jgi:hypothetical protein
MLDPKVLLVDLVVEAVEMVAAVEVADADLVVEAVEMMAAVEVTDADIVVDIEVDKIVAPVEVPAEDAVDDVDPL